MKDRGRDRLRLALAAAAASAVLLTGPALAAGTAGSDPAKDAAERALDVYRGFVPWEDFGFASQEELRDAVVAEGVPVFRLDPSALDGRLHRLGDAIRDVRLVEFVIAGGHRAVTRLTLRRTEDGYERVGFGGDGEHLRRGLSLLPAPEGARLVLLGPVEFLYWSGEEAEYLVNINGFALAGLEPLRLYTPEEALPGLRQYARGLLGLPDEPGLPPAAAWTLAATGALFVGWVVHGFWQIARR